MMAIALPPLLTWLINISIRAVYYYCYSRFTSPWTLSGTTQVSQYQKGKTSLDLLKQEIVSGSGVSWAICKSVPRPIQNLAGTPPLSFLQAGCPSWRPTNSVKALTHSLTGPLDWRRVVAPSRLHDRWPFSKRCQQRARRRLPADGPRFVSDGLADVSSLVYCLDGDLHACRLPRDFNVCRHVIIPLAPTTGARSLK